MTAVKKLKRLVNRLLPNNAIGNYPPAALRFYKVHGRLPLRVDPSAGINDYIFWRMISNRWSPQELQWVDKETAKAAASGYRSLNVAKTERVIHMDNVDPARFNAILSSYIGQPLVAKPTNASGSVVFLGQSPAEADIIRLRLTANSNYLWAHRESQYAYLVRKVIIEEDLTALSDGIPDDFKFHCSRGRLIYCQYDTGRFTDHRRSIIAVPDFHVTDQQVSFPHPSVPPRKPASWEAMLEIARQISLPFDYVRIDLYDIKGRVYFGELTFTPGAAIGDYYYDKNFERLVLQRVIET